MDLPDQQNDADVIARLAGVSRSTVKIPVKDDRRCPRRKRAGELLSIAIQQLPYSDMDIVVAVTKTDHDVGAER